MARRVNIKVRDYENLSDENIKKVIGLLEAEKPITKKEACNILNIAYNTKRLGGIIDSYVDKIATRKRIFSANRGKAWDVYDTKRLVLGYLKGDSISELSSSLFRSNGAIKKKLELSGVPLRKSDEGYFNPGMLPEDCSKEVYGVGDLVWSSRYCCVVEITNLFQTHEEYGNVYGIWIYGKHNQFGYQPWYELGELPILKEIGATAESFSKEEF